LRCGNAGNRSQGFAFFLQDETHAAEDPALIRVPAGFKKEIIMLGWALTFLVIALIAAVLGFGGIAGASAGIAQILFFVFLALFVISLIARAVRGRPPL
jgi:uncharacterized membrane protein YtjA (UPF0391 family)